MKTAQIKKMSLVLLAAAAVALLSPSAKAVGNTQAPPAGNDTTGAEFLITWNGTTFSASAPSGQGPFDGTEDTLYGVQNNSTTPLLSLTISGPNIFGFDGDGVSTFTGFPSGSTGYEGSISTTSVFDAAGPLDSFNVIDFDHGSVIFGAAGIPAGGSAYFSLEEHTSVTCGPTGCNTSVPDTGSTLAYLGIACAVGLGLKRRLSIAR
jgi:hypothetical protein